MQRVLHLQETLRLLLGHLLDRDARPQRDDLRYLVLADGEWFLALLALAPALFQLPALHCELLLVVPQAGGLLELLAVNGGLFLGPDLDQLVVHFLVIRR